MQKELDLSQPIVLRDDFAIKSKKLLIMRGKELLHAIQDSYKCIQNSINLIMIDVDVRL